MVAFTLDISDLIDIPDPSELSSLVEKANKALSINLYANWVNGSNELRTSKEVYQSAIQMQDGGFVSLVGEKDSLQYMVEGGLDPFDMKQGVSSYKNAKQNEDGKWYAVIPFRLATRDTGKTSKDSIIPREISKTLRKKSSSKGVTRINLDSIPNNKDRIKRRTVTIDKRKFNEYEHKSHQFEGVQRKGTASRGEYSKFRTISENSAENAWIHTGIEARNFGKAAFDKTVLEAPEIVESIIMDYL